MFRILQRQLLIAPYLLYGISVIFLYDVLTDDYWLLFAISLLSMLYAYRLNNFFFQRQPQFKKSHKHIIILIAVFSLIVSINLVIFLNFPGLSEDPNVGKMGVRGSPFSVRVFRYIGITPVYFFILNFIHLNKKFDIVLISLYSILMAIIGFLLGFKGFAFIYLIPLLYLFSTIFKRSFVLWVAFFIVILFNLVSYIEGIGISETLQFIVDRFGATQVLGSQVLLNEKFVDYSYYPPFSEVVNMIGRVLGDYQLQSLQQKAFSVVHPDNTLGMEVANYYAIEFVYSYGIYIGLPFYFVITFVIYQVITKFNSALSTSLAYLVFMTVLDGLFNGRLIFKLLDVGLVLMVVYSCVHLFYWILRRNA